MGDNAVYKKQFYTKLVTSCHFMFLYLYICSFFFLFVLLKTHESKRSYSRSELADALLILFPPRRHVVSLLLSENVPRPRDDQRSAAARSRRADLICGGLIFFQPKGWLLMEIGLNVPH